MNKKITIAIIMFIASCPVFYSQPQFKIQFYGGYNLPLSDLKGDIKDSADIVNTYSMKTGFGFGADAKYYLGKSRNFGVTLSLCYQMFSTSEDSATFYFEIGHYTVNDFKSKLNTLNLGLGIEYAFLPKGKINPFIGAEITGHFISGNYEYTAGNMVYTADLNTASRFGLSTGGGIEYTFSKYIGMEIGAKYHFVNLIGKDTDTSEASGKYNLNDKEYVNKLGMTIPSKNISYLQTYLGITFYLNQPKKKVK